MHREVIEQYMLCLSAGKIQYESIRASFHCVSHMETHDCNITLFTSFLFLSKTVFVLHPAAPEPLIILGRNKTTLNVLSHLKLFAYILRAMIPRFVEVFKNSSSNYNCGVI